MWGAGRDVGGEGMKTTWSFIRFRRLPVPTFIILEENSTPIVWEERIFPVDSDYFCEYYIILAV